MNQWNGHVPLGIFTNILCLLFVPLLFMDLHSLTSSWLLNVSICIALPFFDPDAGCNTKRKHASEDSSLCDPCLSLRYDPNNTGVEFS